MGSECCDTKLITTGDKNQAHELYTISLATKAPIEPTIVYQDVPALILPEQAPVIPAIHASPPLAKDISLLNCVFRI